MNNDTMKLKPKVNHPLTRTPVVDCGKCVCEEDDNGEWLVMFPDGEVQTIDGKTAAEKKCSQWFRKHCPSGEISLGRIEWRFQPKPARTVTSEILQPIDPGFAGGYFIQATKEQSTP